MASHNTGTWSIARKTDQAVCSSSQMIGGFRISRDPLLSLFPILPAADWFSEWRCLTVTIFCKRLTLFSLERQWWDGKMKVRQWVSFIASLNSQLCHTPFNPPRASKGLVLEILWSIAVLDLLRTKKSWYVLAHFPTARAMYEHLFFLTGLRINPNWCQ